MISRDDVIETVKNLKQKAGKNISVGGISICKALMQHGLIDEFLILVQPLTWGEERRLFEYADKSNNLKLMEKDSFRSGVVVLRYGRQ